MRRAKKKYFRNRNDDNKQQLKDAKLQFSIIWNQARQKRFIEKLTN
jgi:hypothetical protein